MLLKILLIINLIPENHGKLNETEHLKSFPPLIPTILSKYLHLAKFTKIINLKYKTSNTTTNFEDALDIMCTRSMRICQNIIMEKKIIREKMCWIPINTTEKVIIEQYKKWPKEKLDDFDLTELRNYERDTAKIIIGKEPCLFYDYLNPKNKEETVESARFLHVLFFTSRYIKFDEVVDLLAHMWKKFQILNLIALIPHVSNYNNYILNYKPFVKNSRNSYGQVHIYSLNVIEQNPYLIINSVTNLNGYPLKVSIFERYPTAIKELPKILQTYPVYKKIPKTSTFYGIDGVVLSEIAYLCNFSIDIASGVENKYYGLVGRNGSIIGSLGQIIKRRIDFQANSRFLIDYGLSSFEYTYHLYFEYLGVLVLKSGRVPKWLEIFYVFLRESNLMILSSWIICCIFNAIIQKCYGVSFQDAILEMYCIALGHSQESIIISNNTSRSRRIFIGSCLIFSIISSPLLTAELTNVLTNDIWLPDINTLEEFDGTGLTIHSSVNPFINDPRHLYQKLSSKINSTWMEIRALDLMVQTKKSAALERVTDAKLKIYTQYTDENGTPLLHIIPEYPRKYFMAYIVPSGSPYLININCILKHFNEAGLDLKWSGDFTRGIVAEASRKKINSSKQAGYEALNVEDMRSACYILFPGYLISILVFVFEVICERMQVDT
ncbi:unnamed protein product [Ceutorhynchus assimilis]|uniref:Ionotropic receptor n=1 Tax=Ceutorhynchus assimilis TaxID=467358 RepID=A0A9N9MP94_9CUCU|nr:unnamed protein product [Ceutorhynchus assimilis]